jgi:hypothetical protein
MSEAQQTSRIADRFQSFAGKASQRMGSRFAFIIALAIVVLWLVSGPIFHFSDAWQLVINTGTTIITFLMVFLIQATQNRDAKAIHLKLDASEGPSQAWRPSAPIRSSTNALTPPRRPSEERASEGSARCER